MSNVKVKLQSACPPSCVCGSKVTRNWVHESCSTQCYMNNQGDVSCTKGCAPYFIQNCGFKCQQSKTYEQFKSVSQFIMALAVSMQSAEMNLSDNELMNFVATLNTNVLKRWTR